VAVTTEPGERGVRVLAHVVGTEGAAPDPAAIRRALRDALPAHMVPSSVVVHLAFPRTPSGKVDRAALAASSSAAEGARRDATPLDPFEQDLATLWCELLEIEGPLGSEDEFFDLGGHSMLAVELSVAVEERFGRQLPLAQLFETPSLGELARVLQGGADAVAGARAAVPVRVGQPGVRPLFWVPGLGGTVVSLYQLGRLLEHGQPLYGLEAVGHRPGEVPLERIEDLAATHLASVRALQPEGPYLLAGHSFGGLVAYEMACRLVDEGAEVGHLIVVDSWPPDIAARLRADGLAPAIKAVPRVRAAEQRSAALTSVNEASKQALRRYRPRPYAGDLVLLATAARREAAGDPTLGWSALVGGGVDVREVAGAHAELVSRAGSDGVAAVVNELLRRSGARPTARRLARRLRRRG
jgi:thioesterase domain-containing protein/acyl carrier protein